MGERTDPPRPQHQRSRPPGHPRARRLFLAIATIVALVLAGGSAFSIHTIHDVESKVPKLPVGPTCRGSNCLADVQQRCLQDICDFLILGSDSRAGLTKKEQLQFGNPTSVAGQRSDTIIFVRVDPVHNRTVVLSIPRDLLVNIPGHGMGKINTAFDYGPNTVVRTVSALVRMPINHYVEVNFAGFMNLVNAIGGIPICVDMPLRDTLAGLNLPHKGCYNLNGGQALAFVRARHIQGDIIPDFSRIARQQQFIRAVIQKVQSASEVFHLPKLIDAVQTNLVIDKNLNLYSLQDLTRKLSGLGQNGVIFRAAPASPVVVGGVDYVQLVQPQASLLFQRIRTGERLGNIGVELPGTGISPANVSVQVLDANSNGKAQEVLQFLQRAGFDVAPSILAAPASLTKSEILWARGSSDPARAVGSYISSLKIVHLPTFAQSVDVTVVVGSDFTSIEGQ